MTTSPPKTPPKGKGAKSERQKRLGTALRENLRKRKNQSQEREKSRPFIEEDPKG
jgi:hypothetical protein